MPSRPLSPPIVLSSTFAFDTVEELASAVANHDEALYTRWSNPTLEAVEQRIAQLEGAERSLLVGSGMAAVHIAMLAALGDGPGPLVVQEEVYGGTHELIEHVRWPSDVRVQRCPAARLPSLAADLPPTAVIYAELPSNPLLRLADLEAIRAAAPEGLRIVVDATFASPVLLQPLALGADLVLHSATKYLGGHHDVVAGVVSGSGDLIERVWLERKILGPVLDPAGAARVGRGLETLALRVERASQSARLIASRLAEHPAVTVVHHPSRPDHPQADLARRLFPDGLAGAVLSFEVAAGGAAAMACVNALTRFHIAASLGGTRSLAEWPAGVTHANVSEEAQRAAGLEPGLLRISIGLEDAEELWTDLRLALDQTGGLR